MIPDEAAHRLVIRGGQVRCAACDWAGVSMDDWNGHEPHKPTQPGAVSRDPSFDPACQRCDYDAHACGGCGETLRHDGKHFDGSTHPECT